MILSLSILFLAGNVFASPTLFKRTIAALDPTAFTEAQERDDTATRAFSSVPILTSSGQCLFVDELSGDFRANLTPIQAAACNGSTSQLWDIITSGKHNDVAGSMLVVNTLTQACMNFDPRRAAGNTVIMFSCGGRADGGGTVTNSQLFPFNGTGPLNLSPYNDASICLTVTSANILDQAPCSSTDATQVFSFGNSPAGAAAAAFSGAVSNSSSIPVSASVDASAPSSTALLSSSPVSSSLPLTTSPSSPTPSIPTPSTPTPTSPPAVSRAGGTLNPSAAAEANPIDPTAVKAFSSIALQNLDGLCLDIDNTAGDFRENLIPIFLKDCDGTALGQKWDIVSKGVHDNVEGGALVVSVLTQGCINFDPRRAAGDTVIMFSCGGRADGGGTVTNSQLFPFTPGQTSILLAPENGNNATCLAADSTGRLDSVACSGAGDGGGGVGNFSIVN